jgi:hypothetical protein
MDEHQKSAIKRYKENYNLFLHLLQNKENSSDEEVLRLLQDNHSMARSLLIDMGVTFKEVDTIRSLNQRIRALEADQENVDISMDKVSIFIKQIQEKTRYDLEELGVYPILDVSMQPDLNVNVRIMSSSARKGSRDNFRTQEDFERYEEKSLNKHKNFMNNFEVVEWNDGDFMAAFTVTNLSLIKQCVEKSIGVEIGSFEYTLGNIYTGEKPNKRIIPYISELNFKFWTLPSSRTLNDAFNNRY